MSSTTRRQLAIIVALIVLFILRIFVSVDPVQRVLARATKPIAVFIDRISWNYDPTTIDSSSAESARIDALENQLQTLRQELNFVDSEQLDVVGADVVFKDIASFRKRFTINQGTSADISRGDPVLHGGFMIGVVDRVGLASADVLLIGDPEFRITATTNTGRAQGIIKTDHGSVVFDLVPKTNQTGQLLLTDGLEGLVPAGLTIGRVGQGISQVESLFERYLVVTLVNPVNVEHVLVWRGETP